LRSAVYVGTTQVSRYVGRNETRESAVFQVDTIPAIAGDCLTKKGYRRAGAECHAITEIATDRTAAELQGAYALLNANSVVEKAGIGSFEVRPKKSSPFSCITLEDVITAEYLRATISVRPRPPLFWITLLSRKAWEPPLTNTRAPAFFLGGSR